MADPMASFSDYDLPARDQGGLVPAWINPAVPSPARIYDYLLAGKDNYAADRAAAENILSAVPHGRSLARANRRFLVRAVRYMAGQGVAQFIDLGTGIPARPAVHDVARSLIPDARVLYVDNDPVVTVHNRALLAGRDGIEATHGDLREPYGIFASPELERLIDFSQPVGMLFVAVLHFIPSEDDPESTVRAFSKYLVPGSYLALSHVTSDGSDPSVISAIEGVYKTASAPAVFRTADQIRALFAGLDLIPPGVVDVTSWPWRRSAPVQRPALRVLAGVGCRPASSAPG
jgi:hypothetical protein